MYTPSPYHRQNIVISLASLLIGSVIGVLYFFLRTGFVNNSFREVILSAGTAAFILVLPTVLFLLLNKKGTVKWYFSDPFLSLLLIAGAALAGLLLNPLSTDLIRILILFTGISFLVILYFYLRFYFNPGDIWFGILAAVFGVFLGFQFWGGDYHNPLFIEKIALGTAHADTLFHAAIANMIRTFHVPGNGLDNPAYLHYHWGSHVLFAGLSELCHVRTLEFYNRFYPVLFIPLFFKSLLQAVLNFRLSSDYSLQLRGIFLCILIVFVGIMPVLAGASFTSESNAVGLIWLMLIISVVFLFFRSGKTLSGLSAEYVLLILFLGLSTGLLGLYKISVVYFFILGFGYVYLRKKWYRFLGFNVLIGLLVLVCLIDLKLVLAPDLMGGGETINLRSIIKGISTTWHESGFILYNLWSILLIIWLLAKNRIRGLQDLKASVLKGDLLPAELTLIICLAGYLPAPFLDFNAYYFTVFQNYFSLLLLLMLLPSLLNENHLFYPRRSRNRIGPYLVIFLLVMTWFSKVNIIQQSLGDNFIIRASILQGKGGGENQAEFSIQDLKDNYLNTLLKEPGRAIMKNSSYQCIQQLIQLDQPPQ